MSDEISPLPPENQLPDDDLEENKKPIALEKSSSNQEISHLEEKSIEQGVLPETVSANSQDDLESQKNSLIKSVEDEKETEIPIILQDNEEKTESKSDELNSETMIQPDKSQNSSNPDSKTKINTEEEIASSEIASQQEEESAEKKEISESVENDENEKNNDNSEKAEPTEENSKNSLKLVEKSRSKKSRAPPAQRASPSNKNGGLPIENSMGKNQITKILARTLCDQYEEAVESDENGAAIISNACTAQNLRVIHRAFKSNDLFKGISSQNPNKGEIIPCVLQYIKSEEFINEITLIRNEKEQKKAERAQKKAEEKKARHAEKEEHRSQKTHEKREKEKNEVIEKERIENLEKKKSKVQIVPKIVITESYKRSDYFKVIQIMTDFIESTSIKIAEMEKALSLLNTRLTELSNYYHSKSKPHY